MADGHEEAVDRDVAAAAVLRRAQAHAVDAAVVAQHLVDHVVPDRLDRPGLDLGEQLVLQDLLRAQGVAAVDQVDLAGEVGEVERLLDGGIAAADHRDLLVLVEEPVAGGAGGHALAHELLLRLQPQVLGAGAGGDDQRVAGVLAAVTGQAERAPGQVGGVDVVEDHLGVEALRVRLHPRHQVRAHQAVGIAGPVVDLGGGHQLAAHLQAGDDQRLEVGAGGVDGRGPAGRAGTEDDDAGVLVRGHCYDSDSWSAATGGRGRRGDLRMRHSLGSVPDRHKDAAADAEFRGTPRVRLPGAGAARAQARDSPYIQQLTLIG